MSTTRKFKCSDCGHEWEAPYGTGVSGRQMNCPKCKSTNVHRMDIGGFGRGPGRAGGRRGPGRGGRRSA